MNTYRKNALSQLLTFCSSLLSLSLEGTKGYILVPSYVNKIREEASTVRLEIIRVVLLSKSQQ